MPKAAPVHIRFFAKLKWSKNYFCGTPCWEWTAYKDSRGYGVFTVAHDVKVQAYRWLYEYVLWPIPSGLQLDHLCRNPSCVNPIHLEPVTPLGNTMRGISPASKAAKRSHCLHGHVYDDANTWFEIKRGRQVRHCRTCARLRGRQKSSAVSAARTHCKNGHELVPGNVTYDGRGVARCKTCARAWASRMRERRLKRLSDV